MTSQAVQLKPMIINRRLTALQEKILMWRLDHPDGSLSECTRALKCSYTAVIKTTTNPRCIARVKEIKDMVDKAKVMSIQERQERLSEIGRARLTDFVDSEGTITLKPSSALAELVVEEHMVDQEKSLSRRTKRLKLRDPGQAIDLLNKMDNLYAETPVKVNNDNRTFNIFVKSEEGKQALEQLKSGKLLQLKSTEPKC